MTVQPANVAIVTGASRGIGAAIARRLATDGFAIVVNYSGGHEQANALVRSIEAEGGTAVPYRANVAERDAVEGLFDFTVERFGGVDILVNNAGIQRLAPIGAMEEADFDEMIAVNLKGVANCMWQAARHMRPGGRIISLSSGTTRALGPTYGGYAATKAAVEALTGVLSKEMRGRGVTVNAISPGPTATELFLRGKTEEQLAQAAAGSPLERLGQPDEIAAAVAFLAGGDGAWVNGQVLTVNGGFAR